MVEGVNLDAPEIDVDHDAGRFRRMVAVGVVLITFFGATVAYLQAVESNDEDVAARDAQRDAVIGLGAQVDASATLSADLRIGSGIVVQRQRQAVNAARVNALSDDVDDAHQAAADRFDAVAAAISPLTPVDPSNVTSIIDIASELGEDPDAARLRQRVGADLANDRGSKADAYVTVLTVLAVALFLLGLSLTVAGRSRFILAAPGLIIAMACVAWTGLIAGWEVSQVSERAIEQTALGQRLQDGGDFEGAIEAYDAAIDDSPDFAAAYARRAAARFLEGSTQRGQTAFTSITSPEALEVALEDLEAALSLGADTDVNTVADAGFFTFLAGEFERSVELSTKATELNERLAPVWFNLGIAHVAQGDEAEAEAAYQEGLRLLEEAPDAGTRSGVLAGARTDLSILREILDDDELEEIIDLVVATEVELVDFEFEAATCEGEPCLALDEARGVELGDVEFSRTGEDVTAVVAIEGLELGDAVASTWYFRTEDSLPFEQAFGSFDVQLVGDDDILVTGTQPSLDPPCPVAGEYLVRLYAGGEFLGEAQGTIEPSVLGTAFTAFDDPIEGFSACVPEGFDVSRADLSDLDSFTTFGGPGQPFVIGVNVTPGVLLPGIDGEALLADVVAATVPTRPATPVLLFGTDIDGNLIPIEGLMAVDERNQIAVASALGPDSSARTILITGTVSAELLMEAVGLMTFSGVGVGVG